MPYEEAWARDRASKITGQRKTGAMTPSEFCNRGARWLYCRFSLEGRWARNVARMGEKKNSHVFVVGKPESLGRPKRRLKDNIKTNREEIQ
jgi:hypothetical protein